jgi:hypothetical protein
MQTTMLSSSNPGSLEKKYSQQEPELSNLQALNKKITKISAHINRLQEGSDSCRRGKAGRAKNRSLQMQKREFQKLLNDLQEQVESASLTEGFFL